MRLIILLFLFGLLGRDAFARDLKTECAALEPTDDNNINTSVRGDIDGALEGLVGRLAGGSINLEGAYSNYVRDNLYDHPNRDKAYAWQRLLYLACLRPDSNIDLNHLLELMIIGPQSKLDPIKSPAEFACKPREFVELSLNVTYLSPLGPSLSAEQTQYVESTLSRLLYDGLEARGRNLIYVEGTIYIDEIGQILRKDGAQFSIVAERSNHEYGLISESFIESDIYVEENVILLYESSQRFNDSVPHTEFIRSNFRGHGEAAAIIDAYGQLKWIDRYTMLTDHREISQNIGGGLEFGLERDIVFASCQRYEN